MEGAPNCWGELIQWGTSTHDWLEGRGEKKYLIHMIDDATSELTARFVRHDSTGENVRVRRFFLERHGWPIASYTDKASLFQTAVMKESLCAEVAGDVTPGSRGRLPLSDKLLLCFPQYHQPVSVLLGHRENSLLFHLPILTSSRGHFYLAQQDIITWRHHRRPAQL